MNKFEPEMVLGVDIGGSHISVGVIDEHKPNTIQYLFTEKVDHSASRDFIIKSWIETLQLAVDHLGNNILKGIGIAMPGPFDYQNGIFPGGQHKFATLSNLNLKNCIEEKLKLHPSVAIRFHNDAACFGIGEAWVGQLTNYNKTVVITLGTGLGATFLCNGIPVTTGKGVPANGELYHLPFGDDIADTHFSTQWFQKKYKELTGKHISGVKELVESSNNKPLAEQIFKEFSDNLISFLAPWLRDFKAEAMVVGGNISNAWSFFADDLDLGFTTMEIDIPIYKSILQEKATFIGGARLTDTNFYNKL